MRSNTCGCTSNSSDASWPCRGDGSRAPIASNRRSLDKPITENPCRTAEAGESAQAIMRGPVARRDQRAPADQRGRARRTASASPATSEPASPGASITTGVTSAPTSTAATLRMPAAATTPTTMSVAAAALPSSNHGRIDAEMSSATSTDSSDCEGPRPITWRAELRAADPNGLSGTSASALMATSMWDPCGLNTANITAESPLTSTGSNNTCTGSTSAGLSCAIAR